MPTDAGKALQELLKRKKLTQREAAEKIGIAQPTLNDMIHGHIRISATVAVKIENVFGASAEQFVYPQVAAELALARQAANVEATQ